MSKVVYKIGGVQIKSPPVPVTIEKYNLTNATRTADGKMKMDLIAKKRKFLLNYPVIDTKEVKLIESLIDTNQLFFTFEYEEDGDRKSAVVYTSEIRKIPAWHDHGYWYWKDFEIHLIEQ